MRMTSPERVIGIVGDIYDCALNPQQWRATLIAINTLLDGAYTAISVINPGVLQPRFVDHSPWDETMIMKLQTEYGPMDVPNAYEIMTGDLDRPVSSIDVLGEAGLQDTRFYKEWAKPQGIRDGCGMKFVSTPQRLGVLSLVTHAKRDPIGEVERDVMATLGPHLRRAAMIGDLLDYARVEMDLLRSALEPLRVPVILVNNDARILHLNAAADKLLAKGEVIASSNGCLVSARPATAAALSEAISRTASNAGDIGHRGIGIPISAPGAAPAVAYVLPLRPHAQSHFKTAAAAVFIATAANAVLPQHEVLSTLFGLTPAEARVMTQIGSGLSMLATAQALGVSENTVKTQLAKIFAKTGTNRQVELADLVKTLTLPLI